jgi:hypothetical protein
MTATIPQKPPRHPRLPKISRHATGQGVVRLDGKDHYLSKFGSPEAQAKYQSIVYPWFLAKRRFNLAKTIIVEPVLRLLKDILLRKRLFQSGDFGPDLV